MDRTYSTREVAQMWNISESTVKRWTEAGGLQCQRTPGGHRRFHLGDIRRFQQARGFEANGLLSTEEWADPGIEDVLNRMDFQSVQGQVRYLAARNQRLQIEQLLMRLYLRGVSLAEIYDNVLFPIIDSIRASLGAGSLNRGQAELMRVNLETAVDYFFPRTVTKPGNGRIGLCASPVQSQRFTVNGAARTLEVEGWEVLNLGGSIPFQAMADMVEQEPINLVCVVWSGSSPFSFSAADLEPLTRAVQSFRLPFVTIGEALPVSDGETSTDRFSFSDLRSLRSFLNTATRA